MNIIALIPARGGSKRIPKKNIRPFLGKPIIEYPIDTARKSGIFSDIIVYTDDKEIRDVAIKAGASYVPRPTVGDEQTTTEMLLEWLKVYLKINKKLEYLCLLYPTAVFIKISELVIAKSLFILNKEQGSNWNAIITFCKYSHPIQRAFIFNWDSEFRMRKSGYEFTNTQDIDDSFYDAGQMYFLNVKSFLEQKRIFMDNIYPIIIDAVDIDNPEDWKKAEAFYKVIRGTD